MLIAINFKCIIVYIYYKCIINAYSTKLSKSLYIILLSYYINYNVISFLLELVCLVFKFIFNYTLIMMNLQFSTFKILSLKCNNK